MISATFAWSTFSVQYSLRGHLLHDNASLPGVPPVTQTTGLPPRAHERKAWEALR
jgi:hypothetical protein